MSFDLLAPYYRSMERILAGDKLQRCRTLFFDQVSKSNTILVLGQGVGRGVAELANRNRSASITCVDMSLKMLQETKQRLIRNKLFSDRIELVHSDILKWMAPSGSYDLIVTHFFLDCFTPVDLEKIVKRVSRWARSEASWLIADFNEPTRGLARWRASAILWIMYRFFRMSTGLPASRLTPPDPLLRQEGFGLRARELSEWKLLHTDLWRRG